MKHLDVSIPLEVIGRSAQFQRIVEVLSQDGDLLIAGVPGSGRRTLVRKAAQEVGSLALEIDCIRATDGERFVQLLAEAISQNFAPEQIKDWVATSGQEFFGFYPEENQGKLKLLRPIHQKQLWQAFEKLMQLPQILAEVVGKRIILILQSFPHIRSWDRDRVWEAALRQEIRQQTRVSYVLIATIAETSNNSEQNLRNSYALQSHDELNNHSRRRGGHMKAAEVSSVEQSVRRRRGNTEPLSDALRSYPLETVQLAPLAADILAVWAREVLHTQGLKFDARSRALELFLDAVQGHIGDAMAIIRRIVILHDAEGIINETQVQQAIQGLLKDLSITFESLLMLLPANQVHLLECLAIDPTDKPQSREYMQKHGLSRGGSLQGALIGLQQKGLVYGSEQGYRLALPLFALWIRHSLWEKKEE